MVLLNNLFKKWPVLVLPGWQDSEPKHWQTIWEEQFSWKRVQQTDWWNPKKADWINNVKQAINNEKDPVVLVSHSLGGPTIAHLIDHYKGLNIQGAFIVAPPDMDQANMPEEIIDFRPTPLIHLPFPSLVIASSDDPFSTMERTECLAKSWGSELINIGPHGHINVERGFGNWEEGQELLRRFLSSLSPSL